MNFRNLTKEEIDILCRQNCFATNWDNITVAEGFSPLNIINTRFEGIVKIGDLSGKIDDGKTALSCGIYNSYISSCEIGNQVHIKDVRRISNYLIEENVLISNTGSIVADEGSDFGNGTEIEALNEGGGRDLPIYDRLTSQIAYLTVFYRHDKAFTENVHRLIKDYCNFRKQTRGIIQSGARIRDTNIIRNVVVGSHTTISGAVLLEEGTIRSCIEAPVFIGSNVTAQKFIILSGSKVDSGAILDKCFVGQGVKIGKQFSAENSVFFANCEAFHGEGCSVFAGPYAVSHHKSTLLIASSVSFFNAGSGTNQSNHMYKLGPVHQGVIERGSKTGSFAYLLLPVHIGPYSVIMGKHYANFDTADFPFSYITEEKGRSELTPAMNLFTVGTRRDCDKWPARDRRKDPEKLDLIHFDLFSPYIVGKIVRAITILNELSDKVNQKQDYVIYKGISIRRLLLKTTRKYYEIALNLYIGQEVAKRIKDLEENCTLEDIREKMTVGSSVGAVKWVDICGMFSPSVIIDELVESVKSDRIKSIFELEQELRTMFGNYEKYAWTFCYDVIAKLTGEKPENLSAEALIKIITDWKTNTLKLNSMILKDAEKEFDPGSRIGYGIDGDAETVDNDFLAVRGSYENDKFVVSLRKESGKIEAEADRLIRLLERLK
ncbi:MAG: DUF4954 family protein [Bacteroidota bacterium]|nr:DUF4954 family protein [Bacteroidota bacterium]